MKPLSIMERAASYLAANKIHRPLDVCPGANGDYLTGLWILGNNYRGSGYWGAFPPGIMKRIRALFPDIREVVHLFSGSLPPEPGTIRIDCNPANSPDICFDAHELSECKTFSERPANLIVADPPYTDEDCDHYGVTRVNRRKVVAECYKVLAPGGFLVWFDQVFVMYSKNDWILRGLIGIIRSTNHRARVLTILEKRDTHKTLGETFSAMEAAPPDGAG